LQDKDSLAAIFSAVQAVNRELAGAQGSLKPLLVKVAPDLSFEALDEILGLLPEHNVTGIVATNTTTSRPTSTDAGIQRVYDETGGLSGRPLAHRSTEVIRHIHAQTRGRLPIIGVGGIFNAQDAWEKITAGATLLQVYTGFVYEGPTLAAQIAEGLRRRLEAAGLTSVAQAVGRDSPT
jgi:dihydroorotate dehydrogenase